MNTLFNKYIVIILLNNLILIKMSYYDEYFFEQDDCDNVMAYNVTKKDMRRSDFHQINVGVKRCFDGTIYINNKTGEKEYDYFTCFETFNSVGNRLKNAIDGGYYYDKNAEPYKVGSAFEHTLFKVSLRINFMSVVLYYDTPDQYYRHQNIDKFLGGIGVSIKDEYSVSSDISNELRNISDIVNNFEDRQYHIDKTNENSRCYNGEVVIHRDTIIH